MIEGRHAFGICNIGKLIYVVDGFPDEEETEFTSSEHYDILRNKWTKMACVVPDEYSVNMTVESIRKRFIFCFGGQNSAYVSPSNERFFRLDSQKP